MSGGPWTRHGHPVAGVTVDGPGRPPVARCGGPGLCSRCSVDAVRIRADEISRLSGGISREEEAVRPCPECQQGKHGNCSGRAWSDLGDREVECPCISRGGGDHG